MARRPAGPRTWRPFIWDDRRRPPPATNPDDEPESAPRHAGRAACRPYSVLLPVGFAVPSALPRPRCALTAPFHPCHRARWRSAFCGTFPGVAPAGRYPAPSFHGARTFLPRERERPPGRL